MMRAAQRGPQTVINVGCAEGYYAIGLARLLPAAEIFAFDVDEKAQAICRLNSEANGTGERVTVAGACKPSNLEELARRPGRKLLVIDCEGCELSLLNPALAPGLAECDIIVECHDFMNRAITPTLTTLFSPSHTIEQVSEGARNPNSFAILRTWQSHDRWLVVNEGRPETMQWLACWSNRKPPGAASHALTPGLVVKSITRQARSLSRSDPRTEAMLVGRVDE
jgi:hypothetical protein